MRKAFEKQTKTIEDQGQKQVKVLKLSEPKEPKEQLVNVNDDYENKLLHSKEWEIFRNIYNKRFDKIEESAKKTDGNNLVFTTIRTGKTLDFSKKDHPLTFLNKKKKSETTIKKAK